MSRGRGDAAADYADRRGLRGLRGLCWCPAVARAREWIEQWRAELWHYAQWLQRESARRAPRAP